MIADIVTALMIIALFATGLWLYFKDKNKKHAWFYSAIWTAAIVAFCASVAWMAGPTGTAVVTLVVYVGGISLMLLLDDFGRPEK